MSNHSKKEALENGLEPGELQISLWFPSLFLAAFFVCALRCGFGTAMAMSPWKIRQAQGTGRLFIYFFCLGDTLLDVSLGLACSRVTLLPGWRLAPSSRSPDWVMMACDGDGKE